jgi:predicted amidophosphoribosyltransferase
MIVRDFEDEAEDEDWDQNPDEDETMPCPHCQASIYDDAERCPECGLYLSREDNTSRKPWWVVAGVATCLAMVTWWILHP